MKTNLSPKQTITKVAVLSGLAVVLVAAMAYYSFASPFGMQVDKQQTIPTDHNIILQRGPPPRQLDAWGPQVSSMNIAKSMTGYASASLPSYVPAQLKLESVRAKISTQTGDKFLTAIYTPQGITARDNDTFESVMDGSGMLIVYTQINQSPTFNLTKWMQSFVSEAPNVRHLETINGHPAIVTLGNPQIDATNQVLIYIDNLQINLVSKNYDIAELVKAAQSIS
jgi:hypothetical protein